MYSCQAPAPVEDSEDEAQAESVSSAAAKAAPKQQSKPGKHIKKKKKGKGDPGEKSEQGAPAMQEEEDLDKLLSDLNIQLVRLSSLQPDVHFMSVMDCSTSLTAKKRAKASPQTSQSKQAQQQKLRRTWESCSQTENIVGRFLIPISSLQSAVFSECMLWKCPSIDTKDDWACKKFFHHQRRTKRT